MERRVIAIFSFIRNKDGGILLPVLAILVMFTTMTLYVLQDYSVRRKMLVSTQDFYLAKTIEEMAILEFKEDMKQGEKLFQYNIGTVDISYDKEKKNHKITTSLNNQYKRTTNRTIKE